MDNTDNPHYDDILQRDDFQAKLLKLERFGGIVHLHIELPAGVVDTWRKWLKRSTQVMEFPDNEAISSFSLLYEEEVGKELWLSAIMLNGKGRKRGPILDMSLSYRDEENSHRVGYGNHDRGREFKFDATLTDLDGVDTHEIYFLKG